MKSSHLFLATILLMVATGTLAGRITPWGDPDMVFPNSKMVQYLDLYFNLDNPLPAGHVMRITLPFASTFTLNSTSGSTATFTSSIYAATSASKGAFLTSTTLSAFTTPNFVKINGTGPYNIFMTYGATLAASTSYVLRLNFAASPSDAAGFLGYIQMETMSPAQSIVNAASTLGDAAISYDLNNAFAPLQIFAAPNTLTAFTITSDTNSLLAGQTSIRQLSFTPTQAFFNWPLILLSWDNTGFTISNLTSIDIGTSTTAVNPLTSGSGTNQYFTTQNATSISIFHNAPLATTQTVKYNFTTANPASTTPQTIIFSLKVMHRYNMNITDMGSATGITVAATAGGSNAAATASFTTSAYQILLSWGVDPQASTMTANSNLLGKVFAIYATATTNPIYQAIRFGFGFNQSLPSGTYQIAVTICTTSTNCDVLENSIVSSGLTATCYYGWGYTTTSTTGAKQILCNATSVPTTGNQIGGRIWLRSAAATSFYMLASASPLAAMTDSAFGTISVSGISNTSYVTISQTIPTAYYVGNYNTAPLMNINGNGPLAALPATSGLMDLEATPQAYTALWSGGTNPLILASGTTFPAAYTAPIAAPLSQPYGGIFATTTAGTKYNLALFTSASMLAATPNSFGSTVGGTIGSSAVVSNQLPGIDIFLNPNLFSNGGSSATGNSAIATCWANNAPIKSATPSSASYYSGTTESGTLMSAHCFTNNIATTNASYLRLRYLVTNTLTTQAIIGQGGSASIDSAIASAKYLTFFWESGVTMTNAYTGASLKADTLVGDFYGVLYTLVNASTTVATANFPLKTGSGSPVDVGELSSTMVNAAWTYTIGAPFMWTQMIMGPYGISGLGSSVGTAYYNKKSVWLSGYPGSSGTLPTAANYNTNTNVQLLRIRGLISTSAPDSGLYPSGGKIALFIGTLNAAGAVLEPLGGITNINLVGNNAYNTQVTAANVGLSVPLVASNTGVNSVRCWNAGAVGNCTLDRWGRLLPAVPYAVATPGNGVTNIVDMYSIITSDASYTANFSIAILTKPVIGAAAAYHYYYYRFGFVNSGSYYIQSWDQFFDNGVSTSSSTGAVTNINAAVTVGAGSTYQFPSASTACALPYTAAGTTMPGVRIVPVVTDLDNNVTASLPLNIQLASATGFTPSIFQGQVVWCAQWNFRAASGFGVTATGLESTSLNDKCVGFDYLGAEATAVNWYCVYCPISTTTAIAGTGTSSAVATLTSFTNGPAMNIYNTVFSNVAADAGNLLENSLCTTTIGTAGNLWTPQTITITTAPSSVYTAPGQKLTLGFNTPSTLANADTISIAGKNNGATTADSLFPYGALDSSPVCKLVPTTSTGNWTAYIACTATISSNAIVVNAFTIPATAAAVTGWTLIIWGFNGGTAAVNTTAYYLLQTYRTSTSYIIDQSSNATSSYLTWSLANSTATLATNNILYQRNIVNARGWLRFDIVFSSRTWYYNDKVVINLDAVASATVNANANVVKCRITTTSDVIWQSFQSCSYAPGASPTITIYAMAASTTVYPADFSASTGIRVYLDNMVTMSQSANKTIYGAVTFQGLSGTGTSSVLSKLGTASTTDVAPTSLTTAQTFPSGYPTLTKWWVAANDFQDLVFSLTSNMPFNSSCRITIVFPSYYNPGLTTRSTTPFCQINNVTSYCVVGSVSSPAATTGVVTDTLSQGIRTLVLYGSSISITNGTLSVRVSGISAPPASYTAETFWVQINGDNTESSATIIYAGTVTDASYSTPAAAVLPLNVMWFGVGSTATRAYTTFTWCVYLNSATSTVTTSSAVQLIFPENWGMAWGQFVPTCSVGDFTNNATTYTTAANVSIFGNVVTMNVTTVIPAASVFNITCSNVRTGASDATYRSEDVSIRISDVAGNAVYYRAAPGQHNLNHTLAFAKGSSQVYSAWATTSTATAPISLTAGTFSAAATLTVPSMSSRSFYVTPSDTRFAFLPSQSPFYLVTGATTNSTVLGCASSVPVGLYGLTFTITGDNSSTYIAPSVMWVFVNNNVQTITPAPTSLSAYYSASSLSSTQPLVFDLTSLPPFADITITPNITLSTNTNFTFTPSSIKLTPASPKGYFTFTSTSAATAVGAASYNFVVTGTNAASYVIPSAVTVSLSTDTGTGAVNTPSLNVSADSTDTMAATTKVLTFTLTQVTQATIYWVVTLQGQAITDTIAIQSAAQALTAYNVNSANQAQYFITYQMTSPAKSPANVPVSNLFPNTGYTVSAVAVSNTNKSSTLTQFTFATGSNSANIQRWLYNYTTYPTVAQRQTLLCQITQTLAVPAINVRDVNGEICGNTTAFYATQNSTGDLALYYYPLQSATDTIMTATNLQTHMNTTTTIAALNSAISSGTAGLTFTNIIADYPVVARTIPTISIPTSIASSAMTTTSIYFTVTSTNDTGFLFVALCSNTTSAPTAIALKQAAANITTLSGLQQTIQVFYYYPGASASYNFTGLSAATSYNMFVVASNNDPSFLQNFTSVTTITATTPSTSTGTIGSPIGVVLSVMTVFVSVISLMFF